MCLIPVVLVIDEAATAMVGVCKGETTLLGLPPWVSGLGVCAFFFPPVDFFACGCATFLAAAVTEILFDLLAAADAAFFLFNFLLMAFNRGTAGEGDVEGTGRFLVCTKGLLGTDSGTGLTVVAASGGIRSVKSLKPRLSRPWSIELDCGLDDSVEVLVSGSAPGKTFIMSAPPDSYISVSSSPNISPPNKSLDE